MPHLFGNRRELLMWQYFYQNVQSILADLDHLYSNAGTYNKEPKGELTITCPVAFACSKLAPLIYEFSERYQDINVNIKLSDNLSQFKRRRLRHCTTHCRHTAR